MCYALIPENMILETDAGFQLIISIASNLTQSADKIDKIFLQMSPLENLEAITYWTKIDDVEQEIIEQNLSQGEYFDLPNKWTVPNKCKGREFFPKIKKLAQAMCV